MIARLPCRVSMSLILLLAGSALLSGCSGGPEDSRAGLSCVDDSKECIDRRQATLKTMMDDKDKSWVKEPTNAHAHASGVRLWAFRSRKAELSCEELSAGRREADGAARTLRAEKSLSPAQVSRGIMFAAEVSKELGNEMRSRRCKA